MMNEFEQNRLDQMRKDPENYRLGIFYFNRKDSRIVVPKRNQMMGFTVNFANPLSYLLMAAIIGLIILTRYL